MIVDGGDLYHIDNLAMSHCMNASFEEIECRNHRQLYSLQLLQSMHHLLKRNKTIYQSLFNEVLDDLDLPPEMIRSMRERQQYWIANERNAFYQISNIDALREFVIRAQNTTSNSDHRRIAEEITLMLHMPPMILGLLFETELGVYFETTFRWYSIAGETSTAPGFRLMELHLFFTTLFRNSEQKR